MPYIEIADVTKEKETGPCQKKFLKIKHVWAIVRKLKQGVA